MTPDQEESKAAWMIESGASPPTYWDGHGTRIVDFTADPNQGVKFATFQAAETVRCWLLGDTGAHFCRSTQHVWLEGARARGDAR